MENDEEKLEKMIKIKEVYPIKKLINNSKNESLVILKMLSDIENHVCRLGFIENPDYDYL